MLLALGADVLLRPGSQARLLHTLRRGDLRLPIGAPHPRRIDAADVWEDFHTSLLAFIARRVRDHDSAEDILQEVMLRIHKHAREGEHPHAVGAWVHQIARNAIADHYRRGVNRREQPTGIELDDEPSAPEPDDDAARSEIGRCLRPLLDELPPGHRDAVTLTEFGGLSQIDAARQLGISTSGMKSRVQRGRAQLRELLDACCEINLDRRARVTSYEPRRGACECRSSTHRGPRGGR